MAVELRRRLKAAFPAVEMQHGEVRQADHHVADVQVPVVIERPVRREVEADMIFAGRPAVVAGFVRRVERMRQAVQQEFRRFLAVFRGARGVRIIERGAQQDAAVPDVRFGLVPAGVAEHVGLDRIFVEQPVRFGDHEVPQGGAIPLRQVFADCIDAVAHAFESEHADPVVSPRFAVGCRDAAGHMSRHRIAQKGERGAAQFETLLLRQFRRFGEHGQRREDIAVALGRPVGAFAGAVAGEGRIKLALSQVFGQFVQPRGHDFDVTGRGDFRHAVDPFVLI